MGNPHILVENNNRAGCLTLNRPKALNAMSYEMFGQLSKALEGWQKDPQIYGVVLDAIGDRVFCAGGDIKEVYERGQRGPEQAAEFMKNEYHYNCQLDNFTKPHVSLMNGVVLGGGVGITLYGTHRVAGEIFSMAMPETSIGLIPDIGGSWFLGHLPYSMGLYLGLTGRSINRADALALGLVTHTINEEHFPEIKRAMSEGEPVDTVLDRLQSDPGERQLKPLQGWIEAVFSASTLDEIFQRAEALGEKSKGWSTSVLEELQQKSPTSLHLALQLWKKGRYLNLRRALEMEYNVVANLVHEKDFFEGIRAMVIDKDKKPRWSPAKISDLTKDDVERLFENNWGALELPE
jgi:enoyl-CoA hydratase/carnithine racemase